MNVTRSGFYAVNIEPVEMVEISLNRLLMHGEGRVLWYLGTSQENCEIYLHITISRLEKLQSRAVL